MSSHFLSIASTVVRRCPLSSLVPLVSTSFSFNGWGCLLRISPPMGRLLFLAPGFCLPTFPVGFLPRSLFLLELSRDSGNLVVGVTFIWMHSFLGFWVCTQIITHFVYPVSQGCCPGCGALSELGKEMGPNAFGPFKIVFTVPVKKWCLYPFTRQFSRLERVITM